jgi:hypothetical protein|nr:hypothetical protein [Kofleriaceae bacterium]
MNDQKSTEHGGMGQSGYTAGRKGKDPAVEKDVQVHNVEAPDDEHHDTEPATDDRFTGRGGKTMPHKE